MRSFAIRISTEYNPISKMWRAAYDCKARGATLDFISYTQVVQHTGGSTDGPILSKSGVQPVWDNVQKSPTASWSEHDVFQRVSAHLERKMRVANDLLRR